MNGSSNPNINEKTSHSNFSSASQIRLSHLKPPTHEPAKGPAFLQQVNVSLNIAKHDNELPDYNQSPVPMSDDQHSIRSLNMITSSKEEPSNNSSASKPSLLMRKDTLGFMHRSSDKGNLTSANRERQSISGGIDVFAQQAMERRQKRYKKIEKFLESKYVNLFMVLITIYALFGVDFGTLVTKSRVDTVFDSLTLICTVAFFIEMVLSYISKPEYRFTFFFWLDLISTLSMLLDLSFVPDDAYGAQANTTQIARAGRVSKVGARAGRVLRIVRIIRVAKFYKQVKESDKILRSNSQSIQSLTNLVDNIVKMKKRFGGGDTKSRTSQTELDRLDRQRSITKESRENGLLDPKHLIFNDDEKSPFAPRRLSQFATIGKGKTMGPGTQKRLEPTKMLVASLTEVNAKQVMGGTKDKSGKENVNLPKQSRVGKTLSEMTTKRVIVIVMLVLLLVPLMSSDAWVSDTVSYVYDAQMMSTAYVQGVWTDDQMNSYINEVINRHKTTETPIIYLRTPNGSVVYETKPYYEDIRPSQIDSAQSSDTPQLLLVVDLTINAEVTAGTNIGRTLFVCILFTLGSLIFSKDANDLVLRPLERMVEKVNRIAVSPLSVKRENLLDETQKRNEMVVLENAITKIGTLLALGFGDAGAEIIAQNITQSGDMDPMVSGEKIMAIFGFCDIRNFTDATEVLQQDVMAFVNSIAELVHDKIDKYGGAANKNIGDAFLLVWKFPRSEVEEMDDELQLKNTDLVKGMADLSLFAFLKIFAKINQSHVLRKYRTNPKLLERLPGFRVKMGFGLHVGWAIEGAIGSEFKIDASYLSPNVNIASRLEAATKQYGVPLLVSNDLYVLFSEEVQRYCRKIDVVTVKGSQVPLALYTVDIDAGELRDKGASKRTKKERIRRHEMKKQKLLELIWEGKLSTHLLFEKDKDLKIAMKKGFQNEPKKIWEDGFTAYIEGDWMKARLMLDRYLVMRENDGPATTLLRYMNSLEYRKPNDWRGFRELTEK